MILQIRADAGAVSKNLDAMLAQFAPRADAGEFHQLDGIDRPSGKDHLTGRLKLPTLPSLLKLDSNCPPAVEQDARRQRMFNHGQIGSLARFIKIGLGCRTACSIAHCHVHPAETLLTITIIVFGQIIARLLRRFEPGLVQRVLQRTIAGR